jgi:hypothetical protein
MTKRRTPPPPEHVGSIIDVIDDVFPRWFRNRASWQAWLVFLRALFALPLSPDQLATYRAHTGRSSAPTEPAEEGWLVVGRRGGKTLVLALVAVYLACFRSYAEYLQPGERATILVIARDRRQARNAFRFVRGFLTEVPMLKHLVERETDEAFDLANGVTIEIATASFRSVRGYTIAAALLDELAFWDHDDSAEPDHEILDAIRPGMVTIPGSLLLCASSPYARRGALWDAWQRHYGREGDRVLVWKAPTRAMNPLVPQRVVDEALAADPAKYAAEYLAEFRSDLEAYVSREVVEASVAHGVYERAPVSGISYRAFCDPAGGSGGDSMTLSIAHRDGDRVIVDAVRERKPPFSPDDATQEFAALIKLYGISSCRGDFYGGDWPAERFRAHGIHYERASRIKSEIYRDCLPLLNADRVVLLDNPRLVAQLCSLERRTARGGKDSIDHPSGSHDDLVNAVAGAIVELSPAGAEAWIDYVAAESAAARAAAQEPPADYDESVRRVPVARLPGLPAVYEPEPPQPTFSERAEAGGARLAKSYMDIMAAAGVAADGRAGARGAIAMPPSPKCSNCGNRTGSTRVSSPPAMFCDMNCYKQWQNKTAAANRERVEALARSQNLPVAGLRG